MPIQLKRIYDELSASDGKRILVDRLWPRGIKKEDAKLDLWAKEVAPSNELRKWYAHDEEKWDEFQVRYRAELDGNAKLAELKQYIGNEKVTFLYAAKTTEYCHPQVLIAVLEAL
ncbi:Uncharacterized conserved protein YeaO, DUF488 family [Acinetobacter marinus]|uniref:Uncharacterized conserved protein YeaO, DUF488 family n=1 Tax=Acinetobacter marinus TaxID=281375 RepID=A0A1G6N8A5_9GAMM|nr:DUF488 domain-containing protein [Acinetobacter marinus]SDC64069.1 Uncharacterized conserved protein YeaO, DUF488 family [Acinetobacter marinus]